MHRLRISCVTLFAILAGSGSAAGQMAGVAPSQCPAPQGLPDRPVLEEELQPGAVFLSGDSVESIAGGISRLQGNAEIARDSQQARAAVADYDQAAENVELKGAVDYWDNNLYLHAEAAQINLAEKSASLSDARYRILANRGHGQADELHVLADRVSEGRNIDYTTCDPSVTASGQATETWKLSAEKITLNHETHWGVGRNVVLKIKDIPVLYTPYISFPLDNKRKTGFLTPSFGNTRRNGIEVQTPFYWNIAPNMDATITPRFIADSGLMLMGEYRYLTDNSHGWINAEYLPSDNNYHDADRGFISLEHEQSFSHHGKLHVMFNHLSDARYLEDFGPSLDVTSLSAVDRYVDFSFEGDNWKAFARIQDFQNVNRSGEVASNVFNFRDYNYAYPYLIDPYKRLPQIGFNYTSPQKNHTFNFALNSEFDYFERNVTGIRAFRDAASLGPAPTITPAVFDGTNFTDIQQIIRSGSINNFNYLCQIAGSAR